MRQPLYPIFLAGIQSVFGTNIRFVQVLQALLITGTVVIFYFLARRIFDARISFLAAVLLSIYIPFTVRAALIMSEALFIFLMFLSLYLVVAALQEQRGKYYIAAGVVLGLAFLTRPVVILLPLALIPLLIFFARHQASMAARFSSTPSSLSRFWRCWFHGGYVTRWSWVNIRLYQVAEE